MTAPNYWVVKFKFREKIYLIFLKTFSKKVTKNVISRYLENYKTSSSQIMRQDSQILRVPSQPPNTGLRIPNF